VKRYLAKTIHEHEETFDPNNIRDFIDLYHRVSMDKSDPEVFTGKSGLIRGVHVKYAWIRKLGFHGKAL
jgi:hypothetical protein